MNSTLLVDSGVYIIALTIKTDSPGSELIAIGHARVMSVPSLFEL